MNTSTSSAETNMDEAVSVGSGSGSGSGAKRSSFKANVIGVLVFLVFLWNWDGFWHTNIKSLNDLQLRFFPVKFIEEQKKLNNMSENEFVFDFYDEALAKQRVQIAQLSAEAEVEEKKCAYLKTSLMIIKNMTRKMSSDDLAEAVRCTNEECEDIVSGNRSKLNFCY